VTGSLLDLCGHTSPADGCPDCAYLNALGGALGADIPPTVYRIRELTSGLK
jgi:hypothetical protein